MSFDDQIRDALDRALIVVRGHLDTDLRAESQDRRRSRIAELTQEMNLIRNTAAAVSEELGAEAARLALGTVR